MEAACSHLSPHLEESSVSLSRTCWLQGLATQSVTETGWLKEVGQ